MLLMVLSFWKYQFERRCVLCCSVLMVVGAGRGPLVRASIAASHQADRKIKKVYAVEKNPNAVVT